MRGSTPTSSRALCDDRELPGGQVIKDGVGVYRHAEELWLHLEVPGQSTEAVFPTQPVEVGEEILISTHTIRQFVQQTVDRPRIVLSEPDRCPPMLPWVECVEVVVDYEHCWIRAASELFSELVRPSLIEDFVRCAVRHALIDRNDPCLRTEAGTKRV